MDTYVSIQTLSTYPPTHPFTDKVCVCMQTPSTHPPIHPLTHSFIHSSTDSPPLSLIHPPPPG